MAGAIRSDAGDVHIDPTEDGVNIRYRIDGILHDIAKLGKEHYIPLLSEEKTLPASQPTLKNRLMTDAFPLASRVRKWTAVFQLLSAAMAKPLLCVSCPARAKSLEMEKLGIGSVSLNIVNQAIAKTKGIILTTGPTGSGKTTTLYSLLNKLNYRASRLSLLKIRLNITLRVLFRPRLTPRMVIPLPPPCAHSCDKTQTSSWSVKFVTKRRPK